MKIEDYLNEPLYVLYAHMSREQQEDHPFLWAYLAKLQEQNNALKRTVENLVAASQPIILERKLPFLAQLPAWPSIIVLRAQLFENEPKQGVPKYKVKVQVWDRQEDRDENHRKTRWPYGRYRPWYFNLQSISDFDDERFAVLKSDPGIWLGPITRKGGKKGTDQVMDHIAIYNPHDDACDDPGHKPEHHKLGLDLPDGYRFLGCGKQTNAKPAKDGICTHFWLYEAG